MLFREIIAVYCENHTEHINTMRWQNADIFWMDAMFNVFCESHCPESRSSEADSHSPGQEFPAIYRVHKSPLQDSIHGHVLTCVLKSISTFFFPSIPRFASRPGCFPLYFSPVHLHKATVRFKSVIWGFHFGENSYCHVSGVPWLIITDSGLDDWIYWHLRLQFPLITISYSANANLPTSQIVLVVLCTLHWTLSYSGNLVVCLCIPILLTLLKSQFQSSLILQLTALVI
jgi:hypothetical protein